jgi:iron complex outermembrane receptor protein
MMTIGRFCRLTLILVLASVVLSVVAQATGRIDGRVTKDGKGVVGVVAILQELGLNEVVDGNGEFSFATVPAGSYTLILTLGNNTFVRENVDVEAGLTTELGLEVDWDNLFVEQVKVTAGAARAAKIVDAPAAVTSIQEEVIEREAAHGQLPKVLEFTPGAEVTQSGLYDFNFNTRGFNSSLNRRVSTYIDGRDVGVVLLGAQEWAAISGGLDDVAELEFIRGPSAALYGANASSGVINITTKDPRNSQGTMVRMTGGVIGTRSPGIDPETERPIALPDSQGDFSLNVRRAGQLADNWYYKVTAGYRNSGDYTVTRDIKQVKNPEYYLPDFDDDGWCDNIGEARCLPIERPLFIVQDNETRFGSFRLDRYFGDDSLLSFEAGTANIKGPVFQTGIGRVQLLEAKRPFYRVQFSNRRLTFLGHYSEREGNQANLTDALQSDFQLISDTRRYGVEGQANWNFGGDRGRFVIGAAHTEEDVDTTDPADGLQTVVFEPISTDRQAVFSQFDWRANEHIQLVFAGRIDKSTLHATQFSPKAALVYSMTPNHSLRFTFNKAFQVANYSEFFLNAKISTFTQMGKGVIELICENIRFDDPNTPEKEVIDCGIPVFDEDGNPTALPILAVGNDDLELEKTSAWEVGYSGLFANRVFVTVDYYNASNDNFITDLVPQVGTILGNCPEDDPVGDPAACAINNDYLPWISTDEAETTQWDFRRTVAQVVRDTVANAVGRVGAQLALNLDGSPVIVARTYTNVGEVDTQGIDFGVQYFINDAWSMQASYSWFDFELAESDAPDCALPPGHPRRPLCIKDILLPNTPTHKASLSVSFVKNRWATNLSGRWVDEFFWSAGVFQGPVEGYVTADLSASCAFNDRIQLGLNIANLMDNEHNQTWGGDLLARRALLNLTFRW